MSKGIEYSERYSDELYEYRHVVLPRDLGQQIKSKGLLSEEQWRALGITQSRGWVHYDMHRPEPHVLLFRRPLGTDPKTGLVEPKLKAQLQAEVVEKRLVYSSQAN